MVKVAFVGSRSLLGSTCVQVSRLAASVVRSGSQVVVGCAAGADRAALLGASSVSISAVSVFAAFGIGGRGACGVSAVSDVYEFAYQGGSVSWWSGGGPAVPLKVRLAVRAQKVVSGSSFVVAFFGGSNSVGTLRACQFAVSLGLPVFAFSEGVFLPSLGGGSWLELSQFKGVIPPGLTGASGGFTWVPASSQLALF